MSRFLVLEAAGREGKEKKSVNTPRSWGSEPTTIWYANFFLLISFSFLSDMRSCLIILYSIIGLTIWLTVWLWLPSKLLHSPRWTSPAARVFSPGYGCVISPGCGQVGRRVFVTSPYKGPLLTHLQFFLSLTHHSINPQVEMLIIRRSGKWVTGDFRRFWRNCTVTSPLQTDHCKTNTASTRLQINHAASHCLLP